MWGAGKKKGNGIDVCAGILSEGDGTSRSSTLVRAIFLGVARAGVGRGNGMEDEGRRVGEEMGGKLREMWALEVAFVLDFGMVGVSKAYIGERDWKIIKKRERKRGNLFFALLALIS